MLEIKEQELKSKYPDDQKIHEIMDDAVKSIQEISKRSNESLQASYPKRYDTERFLNKPQRIQATSTDIKVLLMRDRANKFYSDISEHLAKKPHNLDLLLAFDTLLKLTNDNDKSELEEAFKQLVKQLNAGLEVVYRKMQRCWPLVCDEVTLTETYQAIQSKISAWHTELADYLRKRNKGYGVKSTIIEKLNGSELQNKVRALDGRIFMKMDMPFVLSAIEEVKKDSEAP